MKSLMELGWFGDTPESQEQAFVDLTIAIHEKLNKEHTMPNTMKQTHTPGPWTVDKWHYEKRGDKLVVQTNSDAICEVHDLWCPDDRADEASANAHLIASAPELLEALELLAGVKGNVTFNDGWAFLPDGTEICLNELISKAKGGA